MMGLKRRVRSLLAEARELVFPDLSDNPQADAAQAAADGVWADLFAPLGPMVDDADILEVGCDDARLLVRHLTGSVVTGAARSAIGLERQARWNGAEASVALSEVERPEKLELHADLGHMQALDPGSFDLVLCRSVEAVFDLADLESGLRRLYDLTRPGGEVLLRVHCADLVGPTPDGPGYGFLTPTSWIMLMLRAGFEIGETRRIWRDGAQAPLAAAALPDASDEERMTGELRLRLLRPWEGFDLETVWSG